MKRSLDLRGWVFLYTNRSLVNELKAFGYADERVAEAMLEIDRKDFVPEIEKGNAYLDVPLPIGHGMTTSAPSVIAAMLTALKIKKGMKILEVGVGSGYQTALLQSLPERGEGSSGSRYFRRFLSLQGRTSGDTG